MAYQALARKWRPRCLDDVIGQDITVHILKNALSQNKLHHAYLLTGTRGVGKTSLGRILAKCFNCETGIREQPCQTCDTCKRIDEGHCLDFYEIDAASRTKVEDTRELLENIAYPAVHARFKIYLIDEVHMLSQHSFNALLKTLEEPPEHVKFILATTEPKRLPITVLSRCLQFHLKNITPECIQAKLMHIASEEKFTLDVKASELLSHAALGSLRDALSLTDQALAYGNYEHITETIVKTMLGWVATQDVLPLLIAFSKNDLESALNTALHFQERGMDFNEIIRTLSEELHKIALLQQIPNYLEKSPALNETHQTLAKQLSAEDIQLLYQISLLARRDLEWAPTPHLGFEMMLLRCFGFNPQIESENHTQNHSDVQQTEKSNIKEKNPASPSEKRITESPISFTQTAPENSTPNWQTVINQLSLSGITKMLAENCALKSFNANHVVLSLGKSHEALLSNQIKQDLKSALEQHLKGDIKIDFEIVDHTISTPFQEKRQAESNLKNSLTEKYSKDSSIKQLLQKYDAAIEIK